MLWNPAAEELSGRAIFDGPLSLCLLRGGEDDKGDLGWTMSIKGNSEAGCALDLQGPDSRVPSDKKGARGGGAGPAPSPRRRGLETLRGSNGRRARAAAVRPPRSKLHLLPH